MLSTRSSDFRPLEAQSVSAPRHTCDKARPLRGLRSGAARYSPACNQD